MKRKELLRERRDLYDGRQRVFDVVAAAQLCGRTVTVRVEGASLVYLVAVPVPRVVAEAAEATP